MVSAESWVLEFKLQLVPQRKQKSYLGSQRLGCACDQARRTGVAPVAIFKNLAH